MPQAGQAKCQGPTGFFTLVGLTALSLYGIIKQSEKIDEKTKHYPWEKTTCRITSAVVAQSCTTFARGGTSCSYYITYMVDVVSSGSTLISNVEAFRDTYCLTQDSYNYECHMSSDEESIYTTGSTHRCYYDKRYPLTASDARIIFTVDNDASFAKTLLVVCCLLFVMTLCCWECLCGCGRLAFLFAWTVLCSDTNAKKADGDAAVDEEGGAGEVAMANVVADDGDAVK